MRNVFTTNPLSLYYFYMKLAIINNAQRLCGGPTLLILSKNIKRFKFETI